MSITFLRILQPAITKTIAKIVAEPPMVPVVAKAGLLLEVAGLVAAFAGRVVTGVEAVGWGWADASL